MPPVYGVRRPIRGRRSGYPLRFAEMWDLPLRFTAGLYFTLARALAAPVFADSEIRRDEGRGLPLFRRHDYIDSHPHKGHNDNVSRSWQSNSQRHRRPYGNSITASLL